MKFARLKPIPDGSALCAIAKPERGAIFVQRGDTLIMLLARGDKRTQNRDIKKALELVQEL